MTDDPCDRCLAGCFLSIPQHLREERPDDDSRGVDAVHTERATKLGKDAFHAFRGENIRERESVTCEKDIDHFLKIAAAPSGRIG
jgi:hypothetical protein